MAARFDANGEFHGYRGTGTDVTAIMRAQEEHERLRQLESDIAHMNRRLGGDVSLNAHIREGDSGEWQDWLIDETPNQETQLADSQETDNRIQALHDALAVLNPRERRIFEARRLTDDPRTLAELACEYGVSCERVRQIEAKAVDKVRRRARIRLTELQQVATESLAANRAR